MHHDKTTPRRGAAGPCAPPEGAARTVMVRRKGHAIDVSRDGATALTMPEYRPLMRHMRYSHVTHLYGKDILRDVDLDTGATTVTRVAVEHLRLYQFDDRGRLVCGAGYATWVRRHYAALGYAVGFVDLTAETPGALAPAWDRLARRPEFAPTAGDEAALDRLLDAGAIPPVDLARRVKQAELVRVVAGWIDRRLNCVVQAPPGLGKSWLLAAFGLLYRRAKIAVVVPGRDNFFKTHAHLTKYLPSVGQQGCGKRMHVHPRVTVYTHESAAHIDDDTDLVLVDEVHEALAPSVAATLAQVAPHAVRVGLSATPTGRIDGSDARLEGMFGPVVYAMTWPEAVALGLIVPIEVRWLACDFAANPLAALPARFRDDPYRRKLHAIWRHDARNALIAEYARKHADDQVLIMVDKVEHLLHLARLLPEFTPVYGQRDVESFQRFKDRGLIDDGFTPISAAGRDEARLAFESGALRKVIATDVWSRGVSFDQLQVLFRADGRSSPILDEQIPGRVSRIHDATAKRTGVLYDCDDAFDPGCAAAAGRRRANYRSKGWTQSTVGVRHNLAR